MRQVELFPGIRTSALGFGCAPILGAIDARTAAKAVHAALDHGVTHFDLARSYGYGQAEAFVGRLLKPHRSQVCIATKFGIRANWKASLMQPLKPIVRRVRTQRRHRAERADQPTSRSTVIADRFHDRIVIDTKHMHASLEASLRAMQTDYVDCFLVHEPIETIDSIDDLIEAAQRLKGQGKVRAFGFASPSIEDPAHVDYLDQFDVLQFAAPAASDLVGVAETWNSRGNILFSPLRARDQLSPAQRLSRLAEHFPSAVILCSMFNPQHLIENVAALDG